MTDHDIIVVIIIVGAVFFIVDCFWKAGVQQRLDNLEKGK